MLRAGLHPREGHELGEPRRTTERMVLLGETPGPEELRRAYFCRWGAAAAADDPRDDGSDTYAADDEEHVERRARPARQGSTGSDDDGVRDQTRQTRAGDAAANCHRVAEEHWRRDTDHGATAAAPCPQLDAQGRPQDAAANGSNVIYAAAAAAPRRRRLRAKSSPAAYFGSSTAGRAAYLVSAITGLLPGAWSSSDPAAGAANTARPPEGADT